MKVYFSKKRLPPNVPFIVNLCLIMGKYHIHKQKWVKGKPKQKVVLYVKLLCYLYDDLIPVVFFCLYHFIYFFCLLFPLLVLLFYKYTVYFLFVVVYSCLIFILYVVND